MNKKKIYVYTVLCVLICFVGFMREEEATRNHENTNLLVEAMASCTAITYVNGKLVGDPLDVQMFKATGWVLDETD